MACARPTSPPSGATSQTLGMTGMQDTQCNSFASFGAVGMTAVDFAGFVDRLAQVSGEVILPFFRFDHRRRGQVARRRVRSRHRGRPRRRGGDAAADRPDLPRPWRHRRRIRAGPARRRICLGARPDRRHQELHLRPADLGHADRPDASRQAGLRHDVAALHPRALLRRRQAHAAALRWRRRAASAAERMGRRARCARAPARASPRRR